MQVCPGIRAWANRVIACALVALPCAAMAQDGQFYLGIGLGQAQANGVCDDVREVVAGTGAGGVTSCDEKDTAWKLFGGYQFNRHFALEASYFDYGSITANGQTFGVPFRITGDATAFGVAAVGILPLANQFSLFGKLGLLRTELDLSASGVGGSASESDSDTGLHIGVGAMFDMGRNFSIRAEWERNDEAEIDMISVGVRFRF
jgi:OmpA-OmpF porin, OOP family